MHTHTHTGGRSGVQDGGRNAKGARWIDASNIIYIHAYIHAYMTGHAYMDYHIYINKYVSIFKHFKCVIFLCMYLSIYLSLCIIYVYIYIYIFIEAVEYTSI